MFDHFRMFYLKATILLQEVITLSKIYYIPVYFSTVGRKRNSASELIYEEFQLANDLSPRFKAQAEKKNGFNLRSDLIGSRSFNPTCVICNL